MEIVCLAMAVRLETSKKCSATINAMRQSESLPYRRLDKNYSSFIYEWKKPNKESVAFLCLASILAQNMERENPWKLFIRIFLNVLTTPYQLLHMFENMCSESQIF